MEGYTIDGNDPKPRPLLVQFGNLENMISVMRDLYKLKDSLTISETYGKIRIRHGMTPEDRAAHRDLHDEVRRRNQERTDLNYKSGVRGPPWQWVKKVKATKNGRIIPVKAYQGAAIDH